MVEPLGSSLTITTESWSNVYCCQSVLRRSVLYPSSPLRTTLHCTVLFTLICALHCIFVLSVHCLLKGRIMCYCVGTRLGKP